MSAPTRSAEATAYTLSVALTNPTLSAAPSPAEAAPSHPRVTPEVTSRANSAMIALVFHGWVSGMR